MLTTSCQDCLFADGTCSRDNIFTQTGCDLGRVDKYRQLGCLVEAENENGEFYIIQGRACNAFRHKNSEWAKAHCKEAVSKVVEEIRPKVGYVILVAKDSSAEDLTRTALAALAQCPPPSSIVAVHGEGVESHAKLNAALFSALGNKVTWRMVCLMEAAPSRGRLIDRAVAEMPDATWYGVFVAGADVPAGLASRLDESLNEKLEQFVAVKPDAEGNGMLVQMLFHRHPMVAGNAPGRFETEGYSVTMNDVCSKAEFFASQDGKPGMLREAL